MTNLSGGDEFLEFFVGFYDILFPENEENSITCKHCQAEIAGNAKVQFINNDKKAFKCPCCGKELSKG